MLSEKALRERKWGSFPALRKVLENKDLPPEYHGTSSVSDNIFEEISRLAEIVSLSHEHHDDLVIVAKTDVGSREAICRELLNLRDRFLRASSFFDQQISVVDKLCEELC